MNPRFSVSVLTYTAIRQAKACIASVLKSTVPFKLILTANGNPEAAAFFNGLACEFPFITVVVNPTNEGFIEPNRKALAMCDTELLVLLNDDTIVPPNWLEKLGEPFDLYPTTAALSGPKGGCQALQPSFHGYRGPAFEYLEGSCLCCKTETMKKHGLFDPHLKFAYGEDSDLSLRMREMGYTLHQVDFHLHHEIGATSRSVVDVRKYQNENHAYLIKRWAPYLKARKMEYPTIIRRGAALGDVLLTTPVIQALRVKRPLSPIYVETLCPLVFANNPHVRRADRRMEKMPDALFFVLDGTYERQPDRPFVHTFAEACGLTIEEVAPYKTELYPSTVEEKKAGEWLVGGEWVAVHAGPNTWKSKEWPRERFAEVIAYLRGRGLKVVLVGSAAAGFVVDQDLRGRTSILETAAVLKRCVLFIGLDSFCFHCAEAMGTPAIGLFGVTDPQFIMTRPENSIGLCDRSVPSFGLRHRTKGVNSVDDGGAAMNAISVPMVLSAIEQMLSRDARGQSGLVPQTIQASV